MTDSEDGTELVYEAFDAAEAGMLERVLVEAGIGVTVVLLHDTAYPGITDQARPYGELRVAAQDVERAQSVLADYLEHEDEAVVLEGPDDVPMDAAASPGSRGGGSGLLPVLMPIALMISLAGNLLLVWMMYASPGATEVESHDADGYLVMKSMYDTPGSAWPHRWEVYDREGRVLSASVDANSNGWPERHTFFDRSDGTSVHHDRDEDGLYERWTYERSGAIVFEGADEDGDGFVEEVRCEDDGQVRVVLLDECRTWLD